MSEFVNRQLRHVHDRVRDKYVCADCFDDLAIKKFVNSHLKWPACTYCGRTSSELISSSFNDVLHFMMEGIRFEWIASTPEVEWEAQNLGWHGGRDGLIRSNFLVQNLVPAIGTAKKEILQDIIGSISSEWRPRKRYDPEPEDFFSYRWEEFADAVKYHTRYVYYRANTGWQKDISNRNKNSRFKTRPLHVIEEVLDKILTLDIIRTIASGTTIWRGRIHDATVSLSTAEVLGPPSFTQALASTRMSPAGIPVFYGAFDRETAVAETIMSEKEKKTSGVVTLGVWKTLIQFRVLDLAGIPAMPSLFDVESRGLRSAVSFLESFADEVARPILKDGREHIEYVPTQVFTEYIRHVYRGQGRDGLDGMLYKSAIKEGGINCVLFIEKKDCLNYVEPLEPGRTKYEQKMLLETMERVPSVEAYLLLPEQDTHRFS